MADYILKRVPPLSEQDGTPRYYAALAHMGTRDLMDLAKHISDHTLYDVATITAVMEEVFANMGHWLAEGYYVKLGDLGTFSLSLDAPIVENPSALHAQKVSFGEVKFRPDKRFSRRLKGKLQRARHGGTPAEGVTTTLEERLALLAEYLEENTLITCPQYGRLTGLRPTQAREELRNWASEGILARKGAVPHIYYTKGS